MLTKEDFDREVDEQLRGLERRDWIELAEGLVVAVLCLGGIVAACWALPRVGALVKGWLS